MNIVLAPYGSHGDFRPQLALALRMREIGHQVHFCTNIDHRSFIEQHGFAYTPVNFSLNDFLKISAMKDKKKIAENQKIQLKEWTRALIASTEGTDMMIGSGVQFIAPAIAEKYNIEYHYMIHSPIVFPSGDYPPMGVPFLNMPKFMNKFIADVRAFLLNPLMLGMYNKIRKEVGLAPFKGDLVSHMFKTPFISADDNLFPMGKDVQYPHHQVGYFHYFEDLEVDPGLIDFLNTGEAPVFIGFGSMHSQDHKAVEAGIQELLETGDFRFVVAKGWGNFGGSIENSDKIYRLDHAPHDKIFPKMAAVVHHGGTGTSSTAAYCGVPQIIMPHGWDQFYNGDRIHKAGIGPKPVNQKRARKELPAAIIEVMSNHGVYKKNALRHMELSKQKMGIEECLKILGLEKVESRVK